MDVLREAQVSLAAHRGALLLGPGVREAAALLGGGGPAAGGVQRQELRVWRAAGERIHSPREKVKLGEGRIPGTNSGEAEMCPCPGSSFEDLRPEQTSWGP